jgi:hypothetical protein
MTSFSNDHHLFLDIFVWPSDMNSDKEEETFYTGKGYQPNPRKEGFHEQVYSAFAIFADDF